MKPVLVLFLMLLTSCASAPTKQTTKSSTINIEKQDWKNAYSDLEDALNSNDPNLVIEAQKTVNAHPEIKQAAIDSFSRRSLKKSLRYWGLETGIIRERLRLRSFALIANGEEIDIATQNLEESYREKIAEQKFSQEQKTSLGQGLQVHFSVFGILPKENQRMLLEQYPMLEVIELEEVGKIVSSQVINRSTPGSNYGSQLGSSIGQAAYIDQAIAGGSYSAMGQLGFGILGAVLGSSMNTDSQARFIINYGVQVFDGSVKSIQTYTPDESANPIGQCIWAHTLREAPNHLCTDTLVGFLNRIKSFHKENTDNIVNSVNCRIEKIGSVKISREECSTLNGSIE